MKDLWGNEIADVDAKARHDLAHADRPGTGPAGETCGSCGQMQHWEGGSKYYKKCGLVPHSNGAGTDIRNRDHACSKWTGLNSNTRRS